MAAGLKYAGDLENVAEGAPLLLRRTAPTVILHGHLHIGHAEARGTVLQIGCAALVEPPYAVNVLNVRWSGDDLVVEHQEVPVAPSPDVTLPRLSPPSQRWVFNAGTWRSSGVPGA